MKNNRPITGAAAEDRPGADPERNGPNGSLSLSVPAELVELVAARAAELLAHRMTEPAADGYLDVKGAAEFLSCPVSRIYALVSARRIPFHKDGSRTLFDRGELRHYVEAGGARRP